MSGEKPPVQSPEEEKEKAIPVFQLNDQEGEFEQLEIDPNVPMYQLMDPHFIVWQIAKHRE